MNKEDFINWLINTTKLSPYSVNRYANAIDTISSELVNYGLENINLYNETDIKIIDAVINELLANQEFQKKNNTGNRMYSASLNHYKRFLEHNNNQFQAELIMDEMEYEKDIMRNISKEIRSKDIVDIQQNVPKYNIVNNRKIWSRNAKYASDVVADADYSCEFNEEHSYFISKYSQKNYVEAHHLIPMKYQEEFDYSLDVHANIVSLCIVCHKKLHYGMFGDKKEILDKLFYSRRERLIKCGINITANDLYKYYRD
ncbi:HNH endonuclease [Bacillus swezeyi]|uniref:HNH endonuclease n=1 Tax=Bacillus swezeyi TaxID=1925020 RepID=UPI0027DE4580|nr:hypothetical protein [Bacillus swezeyi]